MICSEKSTMNATTTDIVPSLTKITAAGPANTTTVATTTTVVQTAETQPTFYYYKRYEKVAVHF